MRPESYLKVVRVSSYITENTWRLRYKDKSVNNIYTICSDTLRIPLGKMRHVCGTHNVTTVLQ